VVYASLANNLGHTRDIMEIDRAVVVSALRSVDLDRSKQCATYELCEDDPKSMSNRHCICSPRIERIHGPVSKNCYIFKKMQNPGEFLNSYSH
jgi:hypothetical protein